MLKRIQQNFPATLIVLLIIILGARYLHSDSMHKYPAYIHAWTQSDRLALAMNFQENGFDFFHPATYNLLTKDGITQVDFPIHDYNVALLSSLFNTELVPTFRWYSLIYSLIGLFFFFQLCLLVTKSALRSIWASSFLLTLPFFVYYQNGFLPSVPSLANFLIGLYLIQQYRSNGKKTHYIWGVFFLSLAALARAPFLIFLIAELVLQVFLLRKRKRKDFKILLLPLSGIALFITYVFYNRYLGETYGSMFLSEFLYFKNIDHFTEIISIAIDRWGKQLLSPFHAVLFLLLLIGGILQYKKAGVKYWSRFTLLSYLLISSVGVLAFFFAFGQQFAEHDYYYLDSFLPLICITLVLLLAKLEIRQAWYTPIATICGIFFFYFFSYAKESQHLRYTPPYNDRIEYAYNVYKSAESDLSSWGVTPDDTLYIIEANSTNIPFTVWGNRGYTNLNSRAEFIHGELDSSFTYAVLLDSFFVETTFKDYPDIIHRLERVHSNGALTLYEKQSERNPARFFENLIHFSQSDFNSAPPVSSFTINPTSIIASDSTFKKSYRIQTSEEFTLTVKDTVNRLIDGKDIEVLFVADYYQNDTTNLHIVCSVNDFYQAKYTVNELKEQGKWTRKLVHYRIPSSHIQTGDLIQFYFWNPQKQELIIDNANLLIYQ